MNTKVLIPALALLWGASACSKTPPPASSPVPAADRPPAAAPAAKKSVPADPIAADDVTRIPPGDVNQRVQQQQALLVCAYDSDEKFARVALAGALPRSAFSARMNKVPRDKQLIFYCSWNNEASAASLAATMFNEHGFTSVAVLQGGPRAWTAAGLPMAAPAAE